MKPPEWPSNLILQPEPPPRPPLSCMYCNAPVTRGRKGRHKGEHIIPEAIGGVVTLNDVSERRACENCNNGYLSGIDRELCSRSFLSIVASQQLGKPLWQVWDVDHTSRNQLVEARANWAPDGTIDNLTVYPQITFETNGFQVRGDGHEMEQFGLMDFQRVLIKAAQYALGRERIRRWYGKKQGIKMGIKYEKVDADLEGYRLAPRMYTPHTIFEIARDVDEPTFVMRYVAERDRAHALATLTSLNQPPGRTVWGRSIGSRVPRIVSYFDVAATLRGIIKIGFNLVAAFCTKTTIDSVVFAETIKIIRGDPSPRRQLLNVNGYVKPDTLKDLWRPNSHSFQLTNVAGMWHFYSCFFGGRICAYVNFPGINQEPWGTATFVFPIQADGCTFETSQLSQIRTEIRPARSTTEEVVPSLRWGVSLAELQITQKNLTAQTERSWSEPA